MSKKIKFVSIIVVLFSVFLSYIKNKTYEELLEIDSCPFCFGTSLCQPFFRNSITVKNSATLLKLLTFLTNILGINNVIFAYFDNQAVVVKKLAHKSEFIEFDGRVKNGDSYSSTENILMKIRNYLDVPFGNNIMRSIRLCPTVEKFDYLYNFVKNSDDHIEKDVINLWFTISVNPEPLIQKILPQEDGWPVSKYLGSCGRTVVSEYCGEMLTDHIQDMWSTRSSFAHQLLTAAFNLTYSHPLFAFYFTDITPDNIVISSDGKVTFIDLENIIIVERNTTANFVTTWNNVHSSEDIPCENCFAFSSDDICSHSISDHNIYAVCREILSPHSYLIDGGLLHSPPETFLKHNPQFWTVLLHCIQPPEHHSRFYYAKKLLRILK